MRAQFVLVPAEGFVGEDSDEILLDNSQPFYICVMTPYGVFFESSKVVEAGGFR